MNEQLSALMDSELSDAEAARFIKSMKTHHTLHETWDTYHLLGDVLRKSPQLSTEFSTRLAQRLAQEPTVLAPRREPLSPAIRHFPVSIAASVAAVSLVGILALQIGRLNQSALSQQIATAPTATQQLAQALPYPPVADKKLVAVAHIPNNVKFTNATANTYLLAHQEYSPSYAPAYVRVVSEQVGNNQ